MTDEIERLLAESAELFTGADLDKKVEQLLRYVCGDEEAWNNASRGNTNG